MGISTREAAPADASLVLRFIVELAEYERLASLVRANEAQVRTLLFGPSPRAFCEIAEDEGEAVGFALWFYNLSTFEGRHGIYLEDLYVRPSARGRGAGRALLRTLAQRCVSEGLARIEWAVLDWNTAAAAFYDRLGAETKSEWLPRRLSGDALVQLAKS